MSFETILILSAILNAIMLICFFILCSNVSNIKKSIVPNSNFTALFLLYCSVGEKEKAKQLLFKEISQDDSFITAFYSNCNRTNAQQAIADKYNKFLKMVDVNIDFNIVDNYLETIF